MNRNRNRAVVSMATVLITLAAGAALDSVSAAHAVAPIHVTNRADDGSFTSLQWAVAGGAPAGDAFGGTTRTVQFAGERLLCHRCVGDVLAPIVPGQIVPNMVVVPLGDDGRLDSPLQSGKLLSLYLGK